MRQWAVDLYSIGTVWTLNVPQEYTESMVPSTEHYWEVVTPLGGKA